MYNLFYMFLMVVAPVQGESYTSTSFSVASDEGTSMAFEIDKNHDVDSWRGGFRGESVNLLDESKTSTPFSLIEDWDVGHSAFEVIMRYDTSPLDNRKRLSAPCFLAKYSKLVSPVEEEEAPWIYLTDLYLCALNELPINDTCDKEGSPFVTIAKRLIDASSNDVFVRYSIVSHALMFRACSRDSDFLEKNDIDSIKRYYSPRSFGAQYESSLSYAASDVTGRLEPPNSSTFHRSSFNYSNHWPLDLEWRDFKLELLAKIVCEVSEGDNAEKFSQAYEAFDVEPKFDSLSREGVSFGFQTYLMSKFDTLRFVLERGESVEYALPIDAFTVVSPSIKLAVNSTFCPVKGDTLLLAAALDPFRRIDALPIILKYAKDVNVRDPIDRNALHRLLYHRVPDEHLHITKMLIDAGVDVNAKTKAGNTPSHVAVNRNARILRELIMAGADIHQKNDAGESPLELLKRSIQERWHFHAENKVVLDMLEKEGLLSKVK